jgi:hypothetical protein
VASFDSNIVFASSALSAADAGDGGLGVVGEAGIGGGTKGSAVGNACTGGAGGKGGSGGTGAGGSGGISAGILHKGAAPVVDAETTTATVVKKAGNKGTGGTSPTNDGKPGDAKKIYAL